MEERSTINHVWIGGIIRYFLGASAGWSIYGKDHLLQNALVLDKYLDDADLQVSRRVARRIVVMAGGWEQEAADWKVDSEKPDDDLAAWKLRRRLTSDEETELNKTASTLEQTVWAECEGQVAFITREKRYDVARLLSNVSGLMADGIYAELPEMARFDFADAGRCIAFELPTAAAFHLMRGTEATLRHFYCSIVKRERVSPLLWYPMTEQLKKRTRGAPPDVLMQNLDNIRKSFRNPTQHPDKRYDIDEVQDLFGLSVDVVTRMVTHLR